MRIVTCLFRPRPELGVFDYGYGPDWVHRLAGNVRRFHPGAEVCVVTDYPADQFRGVQVLALSGKNPAFKALMECYRPDAVQDRAILVGLDQVFVGKLDPLWERPEGHIAPLDPNFGLTRGRVCNAVVLVDRDAAARIWDSWCAEDHQMDRKTTLFTHTNGVGTKVPVFSEMRWLSVYHRPQALWDQVLPGAVLSYKCHIEPSGSPTAACRVVYFHGRPKQTDLLHLPWISENWVSTPPPP